jgi:hypothetical protein
LQSHCNRFANALQSLCNRFGIAFQSFCNRFAIVLRSLCNRLAIVLQSLCNRSTIALQSFYNRLGIALHFALQSLCDHFANIAWSLRTRCTSLQRYRRAIVVLALRNLYVIAARQLRNRCVFAVLVAHLRRNRFIIALQSLRDRVLESQRLTLVSIS